MLCFYYIVIILVVTCAWLLFNSLVKFVCGKNQQKLNAIYSTTSAPIHRFPFMLLGLRCSGKTGLTLRHQQFDPQLQRIHKKIFK